MPIEWTSQIRNVLTLLQSGSMSTWNGDVVRMKRFSRTLKAISAVLIFCASAHANEAPVIAEGDTVGVTMSEDNAPTAFSLMLNASDADVGDTITWSVSAQASNGSATVDGTGTAKAIGYAPNADFGGTDTFAVQVDDGNGGTDTITVNVTVNPVNDSPVAAAQNVTMLEDEATAITLSATDPDEEDILSFCVVMPPANGGLTGTPPAVTYTPNQDFRGEDSFTFKANDGTVDSEPVTVSITVLTDEDADGLSLADETRLGTSDVDADSDDDGLDDRTEVDSGMDPLVAAIQGPGYKYDIRILEDAEDGDTAGWDLMDADPPGTATNVVDPDDPTNRAIEVQASYSTCHRFIISPYETDKLLIEWRMRITGNYLIYVSCYTSVGYLSVRYVPSGEFSNMGTSPIVPLGTNLAQGQWVTVRRNLLADISWLHPGVEIQDVRTFMIRAVGHVDDIALLAYPDEDHDVLPDSVETAAGLDPSDAADAGADTDSDGLTNVREFTLGTSLVNSDSDGDGLVDGLEVDTYSSNPLIQDTDGDMITDGDEIPWGMCPTQAAVNVDGYLCERTLREDAEDGTTAGWTVYDPDPPGTVTNVVDPDDAANRVIQLTGEGTDTGFRLSFDTNETSHRKIQLRFRFSQGFGIFIGCQTNDGHRYVQYCASNTDLVDYGGTISRGIGSDADEGHWVTIRRDVQQDIWDAQPACNISYIYGVVVRGSGYLDDIVTLAYPDNDRDVLPNVLETSLGLDPDSPADAHGDLDSDGLDNLDEFIMGTPLDDSDADDDGLVDGVEAQYGTDILDPDTDGDTVTDGTEVASGMDPLSAALPGNGFIYEKRVLEDAEDGDTVGWGLWDADPPGTITNVVDPDDPENRVIELQSSTDTAQRILFDPPEENMPILEWRMRLSSSFYLYAYLHTSVGYLYIRYTPGTALSSVGNDPVVGIGGGVKIGSWVTMRRNLLRDLRTLHPDAELYDLRGFIARGVGYFDDFATYAYIDADRDLLPDEVETACGLDPSEASDADGDADSDGLSNFDEFIRGTDITDADTDDDGLNDGEEVLNSHTNPSSADTDGDGLTDGAEINDYGTNPFLPDTDGDSLSDSREVLELGTNPLSYDTDSDTLTDADEVLTYLTDPLKADTDSDGLTDADEINTHGTDPLSADTDSDGLSDSEEVLTWCTNPLVADSDSDTVSDGAEVQCGMDPLVAALEGPGYRYDMRILEDAEDGDLVGWDLMDADPPGTTTNVVDPDDPANRVIEIQASFNTCHRFVPSSPEDKKFILQWRMRVTGSYLVYASCQTSLGWVSVRYTSSGDYSNLNLDPIVPLGQDLANGKWVTIRRNLLADMRWLHPDIEILQFRTFMVRGIGYVDDIALLAFQDTDLDLIPMEIELANGLDPDDPGDGMSDPDGDGLTNVEEVLWGTNLTNYDSDGDTIPDGSEISIGLDPTDPSDAAAVMHPAVDVADAAAGLAVSYFVGEWRFMPTFSFFPHYGTHLMENVNMPVTTGTVLGSGRTEQVGALFNGWLNVPADGWYTFHVTNNDGAILYLDGTKVVDSDGYIWHEGEPREAAGEIGLLAGMHSLRLEYYETYNTAAVILEWEAHELSRTVIPAAALFHSPAYLTEMQTADDNDADGLANDAETTAGTNPASSDTDGDGLTDGQEVNEFGSNPLSMDSDDDGMTDWDEVQHAKSNPIVADFDGSITDVLVLDGYLAQVRVGAWGYIEREIFAKDRRGKIEFSFDLTESDCYRVEVEGTQRCSDPSTDEFDLLIFVDGEYVGTDTLVAPAEEYGTIYFFTPSLTAGSHTLDLEWDNVQDDTSFQLKAVRMQQLGGPDIDGNGRRDWVDHRIATMCSVDDVPLTTKVSPLCIEGTARYLSAMRISDGTPIRRGTWGHWFANLPLSETGPTEVTVSHQNGARVTEIATTWETTNIITDDDMTLRKGDALRLIVSPTDAAGGTFTIAVGDETLSGTPDVPVVRVFDTPGVFTLQGTYTPADGDPVDGELQVTVLECLQPEAPAIWRFRERSWTWEGIPEAAVIQSDHLDLSVLETGADSRTFKLLRREVFEDVHIVARLGENGPILASVPTDGFWLRTTINGYLLLLKTYEDGSQLIQDRLFAQYLPDTVRVNLTVSVSGVVFDDGTLEKNLTRDDFAELGEVTSCYIRPYGSTTSVCHSTKVYQGDDFVGQRE